MRKTESRLSLSWLPHVVKLTVNNTSVPKHGKLSSPLIAITRKKKKKATIFIFHTPLVAQKQFKHITRN